MPSPKTNPIIGRGLAYLRQAQRSDGGFIGLASPDAQDFAHAREHPTIFFTALILDCLSTVTGAEALREGAAAFLLRQRSAGWSWNYWMRSGAGAKMRAYPDDLDDTACALAALVRHDPALITGSVLAELTKQLIATEVVPGGPYRTWLVDAAAPAAWRDVDVAVNANISYLMQLQGVTLPGLKRYLTQAIESGQLSSPYYVGTVPTLYFLARGYQGSVREQLAELVRKRLSAAGTLSCLEQALLLAAGVRLELKPAVLTPAAGWLQQAQRPDGSWPAAALYYEPPVKGVAHYAGSAALTTAFCLEAVAAYNRLPAISQPPKPPPRLAVSNPAVTQLLRRSLAVPPGELRRRFRSYVRRIAAVDRDQQVTGMASLTARACGYRLAPDAVLNLNAGSLAGWAAYTIYDDFLDDEGKPELLGVANLALRATVNCFREALPDEAEFQRLVTDALNRMDSANTWEVLQARAKPRHGGLRLRRLPDYGDYAQLAERSWGHSLAACGVLLAGGCAPDGTEVTQLQHFFRHFLIARQLNDDAHDWEADLQRGQLTAVVVALLRAEGGESTQLNLTTDLDRLRLRFWEETIVELADVITAHIAAARQALAACSAVQSPAVFERWLDKLEGSAQQALAARAEAKLFLKTYQ